MGDPANGILIGDEPVYLSEVTYSCDIGYTLSENTTRQCQADGSWSGSAPVCNIKHTHYL